MVALKINTIQLSMLAVDKDFAEGSDNCHKFKLDCSISLTAVNLL